MTLKARLREKTGTTVSRQSRSEGKIPVSLYAKDFNATSLLVDRRDFEAILKKDGQNAVFNLEFEGKQQQVLIKNFDTGSLKNEIYSIDLQAISANELLQVNVPVVLVNEDTVDEGVVDQVTTEVLVESKPANIPTLIELDVKGLVIGDVKVASDLTLPANVELLTDPETTIVSIAVPTVVPEEDETSEESAEPELVGQASTDEE